MRVFLIGPCWPTGRWTEYTQRALAEMGHKVRIHYYDHEPSAKGQLIARLKGRFGVGPAPLRKATGRVLRATARQAAEVNPPWTPAKRERLVGMIHGYDPDLLIVLKGESLPPAIMQSIRRTVDRPMVTWWVDDPFRYPEAVKSFPLFDAFFVFDRSYIPQLKGQGVRRVEFLPCACDPKVYRPVVLSGTDRLRYACDAAFVAEYYSPRGEVVQQLVGLDLTIWGPGWNGSQAAKFLNGAGPRAWRGAILPADRASKVYNVAKVCINIHHPQTRLAGLNTRTFEILASGGFELMDHVPGMEDLLAPGEEVVCYESIEQVRSVVEHYLAHSKERARIAQQGRERVLQEHTYRHRMERILQVIGLPGK